MHFVWYLLGYDAVFLEVLWSELIITGQAGHFDIWIFGFHQLGAEAQEDPCHALAPFLRGHTETLHQHGLSVVNHTHRFQRDLWAIARRRYRLKPNLLFT